MNPDTITLSTPSRSFAYERASRDIDSCDDMKEIKNMLRCYIKLYFKQQETLSSIGVPTKE
jgi:hypothetical protein